MSELQIKQMWTNINQNKSEMLEVK